MSVSEIAASLAYFVALSDYTETSLVIVTTGEGIIYPREREDEHCEFYFFKIYEWLMSRLC